MTPTELVYSSHDRCEYLHRQLIVERALRSPWNKTVFYLPFSSGSEGDQSYSWGTFSWYFDQFRQWGLEPSSFIWTEALRREDADVFFRRLADSEVVILGGGRTVTGIERYDGMGRQFYGDPGRFARTLRERQARGMLTVGFSAGADQLCEVSGDDPMPCYGLVAKVVVRLHFEPGVEGHVEHLARRHPGCLAFGLPNDSGLAVNQGYTWNGVFWQLIEFVTDASWDRPEDQWHIKTRQGVKIEHRYVDGRAWRFNGGDVLLRVIHPDGIQQEAWIKQPNEDTFWSYWSQQRTGLRSVEEILSAY